MRRVAFVLACGLIVGACTSSPAPRESPVGSPSTTTATIHLIRSSGLHFAGMDARLAGEVFVLNGCVAAGPDLSTADYIIWPRDSRLAEKDGETWVVDGEGRRAAMVGGPIEMGGGNVSLRWAEEFVQGDIPAPCVTDQDGAYWLAGQIDRSVSHGDS